MEQQDVVGTVRHTVSFGLYQADLQTSELWKAGRKIRLQSQPFKVLAMLLERPGEVVTRTELQSHLWGKNAVGDFDQSLGTAVNKIRDALGDTADNPRYVETLARRGYRFIAPVNVLTRSPGARAGSTPVQVELIPGPELPRNAEASYAPVLPAVSQSFHVPERSRKVSTQDQEPQPHSISVANPDEGAESAKTVAVQGSPLPMPVAEATTASVHPLVPWNVVRRVARGRFPSLAPVPAAVALTAFLLGAGLSGWLLSRRAAPTIAPLLRIERLTHVGRIAPGMPGMESLPASASDGLHIYVPVLENGRSVLSRVDVHTGSVQAIDLPHEIASPMLGDLSPDQSTLLLRNHLSPEGEQPLWVAPVGGGSALRLPNVVGHDATWMPDGKSVVYAFREQLVIYHSSDGSSVPFATLPGRALWLRWAPDGSVLRFTVMDPLRHTMELWQIDNAGRHLQRMLNGWNQQPGSECCGVWADDGRYFVFQSNRGEHTDLWRLGEKNTAGPVRVTDGPLNFAAPVAPSHGSTVYFLGLDSQSMLQRYDAAQHRFVPGDGFLAGASRVEYSRDGRWVVWVDLSGRAWRAQADGSERIQLTPGSLQVFSAHGSPDGQQIVLMAKESGNAWQLYMVPAEGGTLAHLPTGSRNAADPSWSADGKEIVFGRLNDLMGNEEAPRSLEILAVNTGAIRTVPSSAGLFSPRWSPDGRYIAALSLDQRQLRIFDTLTQQWRTLAETTAADPVWAADSKAIFFQASLAKGQPMYRVSLPDGRLQQQVIDLQSFAPTTTDYFFSGLSPAGTPLVRSRTATGDLYSIDLEENGSEPRHQRQDGP